MIRGVIENEQHSLLYYRHNHYSGSSKIFRDFLGITRVVHCVDVINIRENSNMIKNPINFN